MSDNTQNLLSLSEVAERLNISLITVRRLIERGELPSLKIGKVRRVKPADLEAYLRKAARAGAAGPSTFLSVDK
jgi:excisionase family DNA binding protein